MVSEPIRQQVLQRALDARACAERLSDLSRRLMRLDVGRWATQATPELIARAEQLGRSAQNSSEDVAHAAGALEQHARALDAAQGPGLPLLPTWLAEGLR